MSARPNHVMPEKPHWYEAAEWIIPFVVKISTPNVSGTGFLVSHSATGPICGIATAAHVVSHPHYWEQPIRIEHYQSGKIVLLRSVDRAILMEEANDTAAIVFHKGELPLPDTPPELLAEGFTAKTGVEVGWVGFPALRPQNLCFFSGRISACLTADHAYLVDGVTINGVSGGPALFLMPDRTVVVGVVSAYIANRATGETLPGLSVIRDVSQFHETIRLVRSIDEAKTQESPLPAEPPPAIPEGAA
jgi:hypothetical protein